MKVICFVLVACCVLGALGAPDAPAAPYAPSGWRPKGPSFELPTRSQVPEDSSSFEANGDVEEAVGLGGDVEVTEEEVRYTGEIGTTTESTTPFLQYGPPADSDLPDDDFSQTTEAVEADEELTVQGLPGLEPAGEFRTIPVESQRLRERRLQRLRAQKQRSGRLQAGKPSRQLVQGTQFHQQHQFQQQQQFQRQQIAAYTSTNGSPVQQFGARVQQSGVRNGKTLTQGFSAQLGRFTAPKNNQRRPVSLFPTFARQEVAVSTFGAPAQEYGQPGQSFVPAAEYGPPAGVPQEEADLDQPEQLPEDEADVPLIGDEETTEANNDIGDEEGDGVAIASAVATGRYTQGRAARIRSGRAPTAAKLRARPNLRQINEPIFTYNQFGQLVRIF